MVHMEDKSANIFPWILCKNDGDSTITLEMDGLITSLPWQHVVQG